MQSWGADTRLTGPYAGLFGEAALSLYGVAGRLAEPMVGSVLRWRQKNGKEDGSRRNERFGVARLARPDGPLVWVHAASVGETVAALPLIGRLLDLGPSLLLTTGTVTAAQVAALRLPGQAIHQFVPVDTPGAINRFLDHWRPDLALFAESELWPTTLRALRRRRLPLAVINARISERSFRTWRALAPFARALMGRIDLCLAQSAGDGARLRSLGARDVIVCGNLKFDAPPPPADPVALKSLQNAAGSRPVLLAASTHPGEETAVIAAHKELASRGLPLITIMAPRHPERGDALAAEIVAAGLAVSRRSLGESIGPRTGIYLADTIGEMGLWYRLADVAFLGGSLVPHGGQNPIEPAKLGVPVLHGPHVRNFREVYAALAAVGGVMAVPDAQCFGAAVARLMQSQVERQRMAREARACVERSTGALNRTMEALEPHLARLTHRDEAAARA